MRIALDLSPVKIHELRGIGVYTEKLYENLKEKVIGFTGPVPQNCDLVHFPGLKLFWPDKRMLTDKKFVVTVHDLIPLKYPHEYPPGIRGKLKWRIQKMLLKRAKALITDSHASKEDIVKFTGIPEEMIKVVYLAADPEFKVVNSSPRKDLPKKFVLYVGDANYNKNLPRLCKACLELDYPLVLVGRKFLSHDFDPNHKENNDLATVQQLAKENPKKIICLGSVETKELVNLYNLATVYAQPSLAEGFGLQVLEAMACGCPVVTSSGTSTEEVAGSAGMLVDPKDDGQLTKALKALWTDSSLRERLSRLGLERIKSFSWAKTAEETYKIYESLA